MKECHRSPLKLLKPLRSVWIYVQAGPFMPHSKQPRLALTRNCLLFVNCFAFPYTTFRNCLFQRIGESINVSNIVPINGPGLRFLFWRSNFTISDDTDTLAIRKKLLFNACQILPGN